MLIVDPGHYIITTELSQAMEISENFTQMELEELLYSKYHIECNGAQVIFCDNSENWRDARKEKDTEIHLISKHNFSAVYADFVKDLNSVPKYYFC